MYEDKIICGTIYINGDFADIYCDKTTGECFFIDPAMGDARLISELSVSDPVEADLSAIMDGIEDSEFGECVGIILDGETVIKLIDYDTAIKYKDLDMDNPISDPITIDIDCDFEEE